MNGVSFLLGALIGAGSIVYLSWDTGPHMYNQGVRFEANDLYDFTCGESAPIGNEDFWNKAQAAYTKNVEHLQNLETAEDLARLDQLLKDALVHHSSQSSQSRGLGLQISERRRR
jgi:hypothetical protein